MVEHQLKGIATIVMENILLSINARNINYLWPFLMMKLMEGLRGKPPPITDEVPPLDQLGEEPQISLHSLINISSPKLLKLALMGKYPLKNHLFFIEMGRCEIVLGT
jgi:hypothetical protein